MLKGKYEIRILLDQNPYPTPVILEGSGNVQLEKVDPKRAPGEGFTHYLEFTETAEGIHGVHQTELSKQVMDRLHVDGNVASWQAYSGSEGVDLWQYTMLYNEATDDVAGVAFGMPPCFRGYIVFSGKKISD